MRTFGLIGFPLSHSFSKQFFTDKFEKEGITGCQYQLYPIAQIGELAEIIAATPSLNGLNVTIPHKLNVMPLLNEIDGAAQEIGAVNCISVKQENGQSHLKGYNTDAYGFEESIKPFLKPHHQKALVFGDGGAAKAVKYVLKKLNIEYVSVVRNPAPNAVLYSAVNANMLAAYTVLINTTPLGMLPNLDSFPLIPYQHIDERHLAYDLVYNPEQTAFLAKCAAQGASTKNGLEMLHLQAERSWEIWNT